jgi:hypothetical protein
MAAGQLYLRLSAKLPEPKQKTHTSKAQEQSEMVGGKAPDVDQEMADEGTKVGECCERSDEEMEDHERKYGDPEERGESVPTVGDALAKFAAGELGSQKWKGRVDELEVRKTCDEVVGRGRKSGASGGKPQALHTTTTSPSFIFSTFLHILMKCQEREVLLCLFTYPSPSE